MSDAILGVLVGFGLATIAELVRWWWQSRQKANEHEAAVRRAARLILEELLVANRATQRTERGDPFAFEFGTRKLPTSVWNANREVLAVAPGAADEWEVIARAYARIDELNWAYESESTRTVDEITALIEAITGEIHTAVSDAVGALRRLIGSS